MCAAVSAVHSCVSDQLGAGVLVWCGVDFLVGRDGRAWLLEFNVKPSSRFLHGQQFSSPVALEIARAAVDAFAQAAAAQATGQPLPTTGGGNGGMATEGHWVVL